MGCLKVLLYAGDIYRQKTQNNLCMKVNSDLRKIERLQKQIIKTKSKKRRRSSRKERRLDCEIWILLEDLRTAKVRKRKFAKFLSKVMKFTAILFAKIANSKWFNP